MCYKYQVSKQQKSRISAGLSLLILMMFIHAGFLGDSCLLHNEQTAHSLESTLSCRSLTCVCFFHGVYAPVEVGFTFNVRGFTPVKEAIPAQPDRLMALAVFHPPRD